MRGQTGKRTAGVSSYLISLYYKVTGATAMAWHHIQGSASVQWQMGLDGRLPLTFLCCTMIDLIRKCHLFTDEALHAWRLRGRRSVSQHICCTNILITGCLFLWMWHLFPHRLQWNNPRSHAQDVPGCQALQFCCIRPLTYTDGLAAVTHHCQSHLERW